VICSKCGEVNSDTFRFCGMCGTLLDTRLDARLEAPVEARRPAGAPAPGLPKIANGSEPLRPLFVDNATKPPNPQVPPISGPSMLGLNQPGSNQTGANQSSPTQPSMDSLREKAFSGLDSFFEPEPPKTGGRRLLLLLVLLAALGAAGWWTYTNYLGVAAIRKPETAASNSTTSNTDEAPADTPSTKPVTKDAAPAPDISSSQAAVPSAGTAAGQAENTNAAPATNQKTVDEAKPMAPARTSKLTPKNASAEKSAAKHEPSVASKAAKLPAPAAVDTGDADFHKGEAYLYGRGAAENCDQAVKFLKTASAKSNARARSAFGTMYATGHCVARDLPTSYLWFALALQVDPNNQILEKDLNAVWNQMTPPERQMATRAKQ
jgi:hypothetical protein